MDQVPLVVPSSIVPATRVAAGGLLWAFVLLVPAVHLSLIARMSVIDVLAMVAPLCVLWLGVQTNNKVVLLLAFPISLLPLLLMYPVLTGPRVYGLGAFLATAGATVAYLSSVTGVAADITADTTPLGGDHTDRATDHKARLLTLHTAAIGLVGAVTLCALHFQRPVRAAFESNYPGYAGRATAFVGLLFFVLWIGLGVRRLVSRVGAPMMDEKRLLADWFRLEGDLTNEHRSRTALTWALLIGIMSGILLTLAALGGGT